MRVSENERKQRSVDRYMHKEADVAYQLGSQL